MRQGDGRCMVCNPPLVMNLYSFCSLPGVFFLRRGGGFGFGVYQFFMLHYITYFNFYAPLL